MPKVQFTETRTRRDSEGKTFHAGEVYDLPRDQADRWVRRNVAVILPDDAPAPVATTVTEAGSKPVPGAAGTPDQEASSPASTPAQAPATPAIPTVPPPTSPKGGKSKAGG